MASSWQNPERPALHGVAPLPPHPRARRGRGARRGTGRLSNAAEILWAGMLVALVIIAGLLGFSWMQSQGAVAVVRQQATALQEGDVEKAYEMFSAEYRSGMTLPMFRRWLRRQEPLAEIRDLRIWRRSVWRGTAVLWGSFEDGLGHAYPVRYSLIRENGDWRVDQFDVQAVVRESLPNSQRFLYI